MHDCPSAPRACFRIGPRSRLWPRAPAGPIAAALLSLAALPGSPARAALFTEATADLGSPQPCAATQEGCYSNYVLMIDLDGDRDLDIVFANGGGYYEPATAAPLVVYLNDGRGRFSEVGATLFGGFQGRVRQVAAGDVDDDGDIDLYVPDGYGMQPDALFMNDGRDPAGFRDEGPARPGTTSRAGATRFGDVDADGDLDLVVSDWGDDPPASPGAAHVYLNDGGGFFAELPGAVPQDTSSIGTGPVDLDLIDVDGDFDLDLLIASRQGDSLVFLNGGDGVFIDGNDRLPGQPGPYVYGPDACDVDGDGDLDLWLDNGAATRKEQLLVNDGDGFFADESRARIHAGSNLSADDNEVQCADIDGDGDLDAIIASLSANERVLINDGSGRFSLASSTFPKVADSTLGLDLGDVNGDGLLDAVTAQGESGAFLNRLYLGTAPQQPDLRPPRFRVVEQVAPVVPPGPVPVRFAVLEATTTDSGPRLRQASIQITDGATVAARFMGGDLFRAVLDVAPGSTVKYRACATDLAGNQGCSVERSFTVEAAARRLTGR